MTSPSVSSQNSGRLPTPPAPSAAASAAPAPAPAPVAAASDQSSFGNSAQRIQAMAATTSAMPWESPESSTDAQLIAGTLKGLPPDQLVQQVKQKMQRWLPAPGRPNPTGLTQAKIDQFAQALLPYMTALAKQKTTALGVSGQQAAELLSLSLMKVSLYEPRKNEVTCVPTAQLEYLKAANPIQFVSKVCGWLAATAPGSQLATPASGHDVIDYAFEMKQMQDQTSPSVTLTANDGTRVAGKNLKDYAAKNGLPYQPQSASSGAALSASQFSQSLRSLLATSPTGVSLAINTVAPPHYETDAAGKRVAHAILALGPVQTIGGVPFVAIDDPQTSPQNPGMPADRDADGYPVYDALGRPMVSLATLQAWQAPDAAVSIGGAGYTWHKK